MAMTAWSAKVLRSSTCASENPSTSPCVMLMAPITSACRRNGTATTLREPRARRFARASGSRSDSSGAVSMSAIRTRLLVLIAWQAMLAAVTGRGHVFRHASSNSSVVKPLCATEWTSCPSKRYTPPCTPPQSRTAFRTIVSKTGWTSVGDCEMTCRISPGRRLLLEAFRQALLQIATLGGFVRRRLAGAWSLGVHFVLPRLCPPTHRRLLASQRRYDRARTYSPAVIAALRTIWEGAGYPWSVRLKALLPLWLPWARRRLRLPPVAQQLQASLTRTCVVLGVYFHLLVNHPALRQRPPPCC